MNGQFNYAQDKESRKKDVHILRRQGRTYLIYLFIESLDKEKNGPRKKRRKKKGIKRSPPSWFMLQKQREERSREGETE